MKKTVKKLTAFLLAVTFIFGMCAFGTSAAKEENVARISVLCLVRNPGHVWLYVENLTDKPIQVGAYTVPKKGGVSIGTFGPTRYDGYGIYYNVEAYCQTEYGMKGLSSLTEDLTADELAVVHNGILNYKNGWSVFTNCVTFSARIWNLISDKKLNNLIFPAFTSIQMSFKRCQKDEVVQKPVDADDVYRQVGRGDSATIKNVKSSSLRDLK